MSSNIDETRYKIRQLKTEVKEAEFGMHDFLTVGLRTTSLMRRMTGSDEIGAATANIYRLISLARQLEITMYKAQIAAGPVGWFFIGISMVSMGLTVYDSMQGY